MAEIHVMKWMPSTRKMHMERRGKKGRKMKTITERLSIWGQPGNTEKGSLHAKEYGKGERTVLKSFEEANRLRPAI